MKKDSIGKGTIYITISSMFFLVAGYVINVFLGRILGPEDYGRYGVVIALMGIVNVFQTAGVPQALAKFTAEEGPDEKEILSASFFVQIITSSALFIFFFAAAPMLATKLNDRSLISSIQFMSLIFPFYGAYAIYVGYLNGKHEFKKQAIVNSVYSITKVLAILGFAYIFRLTGALFGFIIAPFFGAIVGYQKIRLRLSKLIFRKLILFSIPLIGFAILSTLQSSVDLFFIKALLHDPKAAGYFTASQNIARIPYYGLSAFAAVLFPAISASVSQGNHLKTKKIINDALRYILILLIPATLLISATSNQIVSLLYSKEYAAAAGPLSIIIIGYGFLTLFTILANILSGSGSPKSAMVIAGSGAIANSILCYFLIPLYGLNGASFATTLAGGLTCFLAIILIIHKFKTFTYTPSLVKIGIASAIPYAVSFFINLPTLLLPIKYGILGIVYLAALYLLKEIKPEDSKRILDLLPKKKQSIPIVQEEEL
jgi:stage V sporulation protein B